MGKNSKNMALFLVVSLLIMFGWNYYQRKFDPTPEPKPKQVRKDARKYIGILAGGLGEAPLSATKELSEADAFIAFRDVVKAQLDAIPKAKSKSKLVLTRPEPTFVSLGDASYYLQVQLTTIGGAVNRVILTHFKHATEMGEEDKSEIHKHLNLVRAAGDRTPDENDYPQSDPGYYSQYFSWLGTELDVPRRPEYELGSFLLYHYAKPDDARPVDTLGILPWKLKPLAEMTNPDRQEATFELEMPSLGLKFTKTFSLERRQYHIGLTVKIEPLPGAKPPKEFRYQISGARNLPLEGKWYSAVTRNAMFGWEEKGDAKRKMEDAASIQNNLGSDEVTRTEKIIQYAAVTTQYFASAICVDNDQPNVEFIERARATAEGTHPKDKPQFGDITVRMVSQVHKFENGPIEHKFVLYHGPIKVRLLQQFRDDETAVDSELIERYAKGFNLRTMTDYHSESLPGRIASTIGWTDVTIFTTNMMHWVLGQLRRVIPWPGLTIIVLTLMVRMLLYPLSRRQQASMAKMQEKMKSMQPELKLLEEQYKGKDQQEYQQKKMKLMMANGVNPMQQLGGCLLMFAQMPIFMGLYYCLMENVFFRLEPFIKFGSFFTFVPNLSAPDMLFRFGEVPFISDPANVGSTFYLGPYFNLLPIIAVSFMFIQQKLFTPPPTDEQQKMQQGMFKYMMIFMGFMFYKVAAGLCLYFITSSLWGLAERKLLPKPKPGDDTLSKKRDKNPDAPKGWIGKKTDKMSDLWTKLLDAAEKK